MLSISRIDSVSYYETLAKNEYYTKRGEPDGHWGSGSGRLRLAKGQKVESEALKKIMSGFDLDGNKMVQNAGKDGMRVGMDLTFSTPKSVSIVWANASVELRENISTIHDQSIEKALQYLTSKVATRRGKNSVQHEPVSSLIYAAFEHCNTRANDPELHSHIVLSNTCFRQDGTTGAIDNAEIFTHKMSAGALYRAELADGLRACGFPIEVDPKNPGCFQIAGMDKSLEKHFSKRSERIKEIAREKGITSARTKNEIAVYTRGKKDEVNREGLFKNWQAECVSRGFTRSSIDELKTTQTKPYAVPSPEQLIEKLTENENTFSLKDIERVTFEQGQFAPFDREKFKGELLAHADVVRLQIDGATCYTSRALMMLEQNIIDGAKARANESIHHLDAVHVATNIVEVEALQGFQLKDEQREAVEHLTTKSGGVALLRGVAGAGKTTALKAVSEAFKSAGFEVLGTTISAQASSVLARETGIQTDTTAQLLIDLGRGKKYLARKCVLIIDEAGMLGSRAFAKLQSYADQAGAKMLLVGDENQLQSIAVGGVFKALQIHAGIAPSKLKEINRQGDARDREASQLF